MSFTGGKGGAGVWQRIINEMPPHQNYIELFLGTGAVLSHKRLAPGFTGGVDVDRDVVERFPFRDAVWVNDWGWAVAVKRWNKYFGDPETMVYCDPPYPLETRGGRRYYRHEMSGDDHRAFLCAAKTWSAMTLISGRRCALYDDALAGWRRMDFRVKGRSGPPRPECLWANYPEPAALYDYRYCGRSFRERERIRRRASRWVAMLEGMKPTERAMILFRAADVFGGAAAGDALNRAMWAHRAFRGDAAEWSAGIGGADDGARLSAGAGDGICVGGAF